MAATVVGAPLVGAQGCWCPHHAERQYAALWYSATAAHWRIQWSMAREERTMSEHEHHEGHAHQGQQVGYASPTEAMQAPREEFVYVACLHEGTGINEPDFLAVVDVQPDSDTYGQITHRLPMPNVGDELHHYGWQV